MSVFFNGRLLVTPTTASVVDDSALANRNLTVGNNLALIGRSAGGKPGTPLTFGSPSEARAVLVSGELLDAVLKAFDPSAQTGGPDRITVVRVNPATQSSLDLLDATSAAVISLKSTDYGLRTSQIKVKIETGSASGKKVTTQLGNNYYSQDNISRNAFSIRYTGAQLTATMTVTGTQVTLAAPAGTTVATIDLAQAKTVADLVDRINALTGFTASVLESNGTKTTLQGLDFVSAVDVKTAEYTAKADLQALVDWFNGQSEGFVTATRGANAGTLPANIPFTFLAGGTDGVVANGDWATALSVLQTADVQWVVSLTSEPAVHAMTDAHVAFMSMQGRRERRSIAGSPTGTSVSAATTLAKALNSDRTSLVYQGFYDYDSNGNLQLYPPYVTAAVAAAAFCGSNPGTALTNKTFKFRGLESLPRNPVDTDVLILGGVMAFEETPQGFKCVKSISTWLVNTNYNRVEQSTGVALDFVVRNVREALDVLRGEKISPVLLSRAVSIAKSSLDELARPEPSGPGVIVGDDDNPAYKNVRATAEGDVVRVEFQCSPVIPCNYVLNTVYAVPYRGAAAA